MSADKSDTPRTDAAIHESPARHYMPWKHATVNADLCRQLEREVTALTAQLAEARRDAVPEKDMDDQLKIPMHDTCHNAVHRVYFRAGLLACREYMARFVSHQDKGIAASIRANWWPSLGDDPGIPRLLNWDEIADESDQTTIKHKDVSPSIEALPIAKQFLDAAMKEPK